MPFLNVYLPDVFRRSGSLSGLINNLQVIRATIHSKLLFSSFLRPPVLIYQMGKVGSTTILYSLKEARLKNPVIHIHFISNDIKKYREAHERAGIRPPPYQFFLGEALNNMIPKIKKRGSTIISLVRDPVALAVSDVFQNPLFAGPQIMDKSGNFLPQIVVQPLKERLTTGSVVGYMENWFDKELNGVFGIDVFKKPFPVNDGFSFYRNGHIHALVIRLEDLSKKGPFVIAKLLRFSKPIKLLRRNVREMSEEGRAYQNVLSTLKLDPTLLESIYSSKLVRHFYSEDLIHTFTSKWSTATTA